MKCECKECNGYGKVRCEECNGKGHEELDERIHAIGLDGYATDHADSVELLELAKDAKRILRQTDELCRLIPARADSYVEQFKGALNTIEQLADAIRNKHARPRRSRK